MKIFITDTLCQITDSEGTQGTIYKQCDDRLRISIDHYLPERHFIGENMAVELGNAAIENRAFEFIAN